MTCIDKDEAKIARLDRGTVPIFEPGLDDLIARNVKAGRLSFSTEASETLHSADAVFLAVGTPSRATATASPTCHTYSTPRGRSRPRNPGVYR